MKVVVYNQRDTQKIILHKQGCSHAQPREANYSDTVEVDTKQELVMRQWKPTDYDYQPEDWEAMASVLTEWAPCTRPLTRSNTVVDATLFDDDVPEEGQPPASDDGVVHATVSTPNGKVFLKQGRGGQYVITVHQTGKPARRVARGSRDAMVASLGSVITEVSK